MTPPAGAGGRRAPPCRPPFVLEALVPSADGSSVAVRVAGRTIGRVDPAVPRLLGLRVGATVAEPDWPALESAMTRRAAFDAGTRLLARRPRSRAALERRLAADHGPEAAADALLRLAAYLDDTAYALAWVEARLRRGPYGRAALLAGLRREGVPAEVARAAVEARAPAAGAAEMARRAAALRLDRMRDVPAERVRPRLWAYLARRGFAESAIAAALRGLPAPAGAGAGGADAGGLRRGRPLGRRRADRPAQRLRS